ncbi:hypothetical protein [Bacillus pumilus]|uniref:hypothetical protein n=1 Tax=Bacillus pumilus TaxID=1408 RepID=UPI00145C3212|nr:hypothetical protein [Bacillus pumilus]
MDNKKAGIYSPARVLISSSNDLKNIKIGTRGSNNLIRKFLNSLSSSKYASIYITTFLQE